MMTSWGDFERSEPEFADRVRAIFGKHKHHTMATLRRDGSPRISGTEVELSQGELILGVMAGAMRALDMRRDPRVAIHSQGVDPQKDDPGSWPGEAKVAGRAVEISGERPNKGSYRFRIDIAEVVLTRIGGPADHLVIESWTQAGGLVRRERR
jgi:hypothetical protein